MLSGQVYGAEIINITTLGKLHEKKCAYHIAVSVAVHVRKSAADFDRFFIN